MAGYSVLADTDVDASNFHLLFQSEIHEIENFTGGKVAYIEPDKCVGCGACETHCHFNAIRHQVKEYTIDPLKCEGCGLCALVCRQDAVVFSSVINGQLFTGSCEFGPMAFAKLGIAEENSGKLVADVRKKAARLAQIYQIEQILSDGPPGTGCPVIAAISGTDRLIIVTEPTVSGAHDLERVLELAGHFGVSAHIIINKFDINETQTARIASLAEQYGANMLGHIPFDPLVTQALKEGKTPIDYARGPAYQSILACWDVIQNLK